MDKNKELHELLGLEWGHQYAVSDEYKGSVIYTVQCLKCRHTCDSDLIVEGESCPSDPDYASDSRLVLNEMMKREDWAIFMIRAGIVYWEYEGMLEVERIVIDVYLILDTTGKLRDMAIEWLKGKKT